MEQAMPEIAGDLAAAAGPQLAGVCLGGGYGRGEGGARQKADGSFELYNDLDFFVFSTGASRRERKKIDRAIEPVAHKWTKRLEIDVDFSPARNIENLGSVQNRLMFQELKYGHWQILGEGDLLGQIPQIPEREIPLLEAGRLLLNRGMGLLLAAERMAGRSGDGDFIRRNLNKAVLGAGDAILISERRYRWRASDRCGELAGSCFGEMYARAVRFKFTPDDSFYADPPAVWPEVRNFWVESLRIFTGAPKGASRQEIMLRLSAMRFAGEHPWRNALAWMYKTRFTRGEGRLFNVPLIRVLMALAGALLDLERPDLCCISKSLKKQWLLFQ